MEPAEEDRPGIADRSCRLPGDLSTLTALFNPDYTFETLLIRAAAAGHPASFLSMGPLARLNRQFPLLYNHHLGSPYVSLPRFMEVSALFSFTRWEMNRHWFRSFTSNTQFGSLPGFPFFQLLGFPGPGYLFPYGGYAAMTSGCTSSHRNLENPPVRLPGLCADRDACDAGVIQYEKIPSLVVMIALGCWLAGNDPSPGGIRERKIDRRVCAREQGFVDVCHIEEMKPATAAPKIFLRVGTGIAVYRQ